jgi:hypothetical protein
MGNCTAVLAHQEPITMLVPAQIPQNGGKSFLRFALCIGPTNLAGNFLANDIAGSIDRQIDHVVLLPT